MRNFRQHLMPAIGLISAIAAPAVAVEIRYEKFESNEQRFSVLLPTKPKIQSKDLHDGFFEHDFFSPFKRDLQFTVKCLEIPWSFLKDKDPQQFMTTYRSGYRKNKTILGDQELSYGPAKIPAREYRLEAEPGYTVRERLLLAGTRLYMLYIGSADQAFLDSQTADRFFDSFAVTSGGLSGDWKVKTYVRNAEDVVDGLEHLIHIDETKQEIVFHQTPRQTPGKSEIPGGVSFAYSFRLGPGGEFPTIDLKPKDTVALGDRGSEGIYRINDEGRLELTIAAPGLPRPGYFYASKGLDRDYYVCERIGTDGAKKTDSPKQAESPKTKPADKPSEKGS